MTTWVCLLTLLAAMLAGAQPPVAIVDVTVVDVAAGRGVPHQTVIVERGRITAVTNAAAAAIPPGARRLSGQGRFLIPGLWDMHVHELPARNVSQMFLVNGVTGVRDMYDDPAKLNGLPGLLRVVRMAGGTLNGVNENGHQVVVRTAAQARDAVRRQIAAGGQFLKVYNALPREAYFAVAAESAQLQVPFVGHLPDALTPIEAARAGQRSIEHLDGFLLSSASTVALLRKANRFEPDWPMLKAYDPVRADQIIAAFARHTTWQCPTLVLHRSYALLHDPKLDLRDPALRALPKSWLPKPSRPTGDAALDRAVLPKLMEVTARMHRAGVPLLAGTDTGAAYVLPGFALLDELDLLEHAGIPTADVLRIATLHPARFLGRERELGTVEKGKLADLVLLDADPLLAITHVRRLQAVIAAGVLYDRSSLDRMLAAAIAAPWQ